MVLEEGGGAGGGGEMVARILAKRQISCTRNKTKGLKISNLLS